MERKRNAGTTVPGFRLSSIRATTCRHEETRMAQVPKYFMYFPGNYRWSAAFVNMLGRGGFGGADISELHKIGRLLEGKGAEDDEAWFAACVSVADEVRGHAERF